MNILNADVFVPNWVNWISVDAGGEVYGFSNKPVVAGNNCWDDMSDSANSCFLYISKPPKNWKDELYVWGY